jgi:hypothetical protein
VPVVHGLFGSRGLPNSLLRFYSLRSSGSTSSSSAGGSAAAGDNGDGGAAAASDWAGHPLNAARVQLALDDLPPSLEPPAAAPSDALSDPFATTVTSTGGESDGSRGDGGDGSARGSSGGGGAVLAPFSAVALSARVVQRLQKAVAASTSSSDVGLTAALRLLVRKSPDLECGVVRRAFAYWNRSCRWNVVAAMDDQNVAKAAAAAAAGGRAAGAAAAALETGTMAVAAQRRSTLPARTVAPTLIAFCAAGVTDKTVGALLSLESGVGDPHRCALPTPQTQVAADPSQRGSHHAADPLTCASFDVVVGVSPFPGDRTAEFLEAGGVAVLRQPAPLGLILCRKIQRSCRDPLNWRSRC